MKISREVKHSPSNHQKNLHLLSSWLAALQRDMFTQAATDINWKNTFSAEIKHVSRALGGDILSLCEIHRNSPFFHYKDSLCWVYDFRKGDHPLGSTFTISKFLWMFERWFKPSHHPGIREKQNGWEHIVFHLFDWHSALDTFNQTLLRGNSYSSQQ